MNPATPKIPENLTYQAASGDAVPKSVLNATRVIKATQTTKKYERDTIIENQPKWLPAQFEFFRHVSFSPPSMDHQWPINGPSMGKLFWFQTLLMDGPWVDHAWPCMGVHGISVRDNSQLLWVIVSSIVNSNLSVFVDISWNFSLSLF